MALKPTNFPNGISGPIVGSAGTQASAIVDLTDSTGGTAGNTIADLADGTTYATDHPTIENNFASLAAKVNAIIAALEAADIIAS